MEGQANRQPHPTPATDRFFVVVMPMMMVVVMIVTVAVIMTVIALWAVLMGRFIVKDGAQRVRCRGGCRICVPLGLECDVLVHVEDPNHEKRGQ